ncbi:MAG: hypothetical protein LBD24_07700 [Spirochaetaceae bacterium]|nr:hypothetical protein [Spirochaetaceae bacterium]
MHRFETTGGHAETAGGCGDGPEADRMILFVDFENTQKIDPSFITKKTKVIVMVGLGGETNAVKLAEQIFKNISSLELIKVDGQGKKNALDFFITFYLGRYFDHIKEREIIICSNDGGYDPLINHLNGNGISIRREGSNENNGVKTKKQIQQETPKEKPKKETNDTTDDSQKIIAYLKNQKKNRPKTRVKLENYLYTHFSGKISKETIEETIKKAIELMIKNKDITVTDTKIEYKI